MTGAPPRLIDARALALRRARAARLGDGPDFLRRRVAEDAADRLAATLRPFPVALDLASPGGEIQAILAAPGRARSQALLDEHDTLISELDGRPIDRATVDLIISSLALHLVDDLPGVFLQVREALKPDGLFLAALLGGDTLFELRQSFAVAEERVEGGASPRVLPFADVRALGGLLQRAGFALPVTDVDRVTVRYPDPVSLFRDLRAWGTTNVLAERRRTPLRRETLSAAIETYAERFSDPDGRVRATFEIVWLSGWAPHASQQQPLKPGSAKTRLAEALGVPEIKTSDRN